MSLLLLLTPPPRVELAWARFAVSPQPQVFLSHATFTIRAPMNTAGRATLTFTLGGERGGAPDAPTLAVSSQDLNPPAGLTVTPISASQLDVAWTAVDWAVGYDLERDGTVILSRYAGTTYSDTGLTPGSHTYRVRAEL